jgi:anti-sigma B factor antagonist
MGAFQLKKVIAPNSIPVVYISGDLDAVSAPELRRTLWDMLLTGSSTILLQIEALTYVDSSGLGVLVAALRKSNEDLGTIALACPQANVTRVIRITGLDKLFSVYESEQQALEALADVAKA